MNIQQTLAHQQWAEKQWGSVQLGDQRRTRRAVKLGAQITANPSASLPKQTQSC
jgi:hypothetical protein